MPLVSPHAPSRTLGGCDVTLIPNMESFTFGRAAIVKTRRVFFTSEAFDDTKS